jgi:hypothetical protein
VNGRGQLFSTCTLTVVEKEIKVKKLVLKKVVLSDLDESHVARHVAAKTHSIACTNDEACTNYTICQIPPPTYNC